MSFTVPPLWDAKSNQTVPPPALVDKYWAAADAAYASGAFIIITDNLNELSSSLTTANTTLANVSGGLTNGHVLTSGSSGISGAINVVALDATNPSVNFSGSTGTGVKGEVRVGMFASDVVGAIDRAGVLVVQSDFNDSPVTARVQVASSDGTVNSYIRTTKTPGYAAASLDLNNDQDSKYFNVAVDTTELAIYSSNGLLFKGVDITFEYPPFVPVSTLPSASVPYQLFEPVSSSAESLYAYIGTWPNTIGTWPLTGSDSPIGTPGPTSGSMSASLGSLWNHVYTVTRGTNTEIYMNSSTKSWRLTIDDDGVITTTQI